MGKPKFSISFVFDARKDFQRVENGGLIVEMERGRSRRYRNVRVSYFENEDEPKRQNVEPYIIYAVVTRTCGSIEVRANSYKEDDVYYKFYMNDDFTAMFLKDEVVSIFVRRRVYQ